MDYSRNKFHSTNTLLTHFPRNDKKCKQTAREKLCNFAFDYLHLNHVNGIDLIALCTLND
jgi:hypothetical protein